MGKKRGKQPNRAERRKAAGITGRGTRDEEEDLSELVEAFGAPLFDQYAETDDDLASVLDFICMFWNFACLASRRKSRTLDSDGMTTLRALLALPPFERPTDSSFNFIDALLDIWRRTCADLPYIITDHWVDEDEDGMPFIQAFGYRIPPPAEPVAAAAGEDGAAGPRALNG